MKKLLIAIVIIAIAVVGFFMIRKKFTKKSKQVQFATVEVTRGNIEIKVLSTGTIKPYTRVEVKSPTSGRIEKVLVDEGDKVKPGDILAWISSEDRIALLDAARSQLEAAQKTNDISVIKEAEKAKEIAEKAYKPVPLTNSISGEVIARSCEPGQNVSTQTTLFVISDRLVASVTVDEADIGKITTGQDAQITLDAFPNEKVKAKVTKIAREGTTVSDVVVYNVMVDPIQVPSYWASGMTANVEFLVLNKQNVLILPATAIKQRKGQKTVLIANGKSNQEKVIETGTTDGKFYEITAGLNEGDVVLVNSSLNFTNQTQTGNDSERRMRQMMRSLR